MAAEVAPSAAGVALLVGAKKLANSPAAVVFPYYESIQTHLER